EHGPYRVTEEDGVLTYNEFSWNQYTNVLYLEGPVGVRFLINNQDDITTNDELAADNNYYALHDFMTRFLHSMVLRAIASKELQNKNFKVFEIGNPKFDETSRYIATAMAYLTYGLIPQNRSAMIYDSWQKLLKGKKLNRQQFHKIHKMVHDIYWIFNSSILYNIAEHCPTQPENNEVLNHIHQVFHRLEQGTSYTFYASNKIETFLNKLDVQDTSFRMLIYNEDVDAVLPVALSVYGTNKIAAENSLADQGYPSTWHFFGDFASARTGFLSSSGQVSLDMLTVRGAGHSVPTSLPEQAFQMINNFIFTEDGEPIDYSKPIRKH
ncbi:hypothetical protein PRIPAC_91210, partial [Pristionchus pacificus]|uniref:Peptidase n=1 Tax=Pristionchus pacificus TaxID=54126 RepID=A0A2A6B7P6_PRIPA